MSKLERLLNLTAVLLDTMRPLSANELREKVGGYPPPGSAFHRAFERDKDDLRSLGIPLSVEKISASDPPIDGYRIYPNDYYLPDANLTKEELSALNFAALSVQIDGSSANEAIWKLGSSSGPETQNMATQEESAQLPKEFANLPVDPALIVLFQAITTKSSVTFTYKDVKRFLDPWKLDFRRGRWYLTGYDHAHASERNYRLDRMQSEVIRQPQGSSFTAATVDSKQHKHAWQYGDQSREAELWISASRADTARKQLGESAKIITNEDGSLQCFVQVSNFEPFQSLILGFLEHAELIAPEDWRQQLIEWLTTVRAANA